MNLIYHIILAVTLFGIYVEMHPKMGGIVLRPNSKNSYSLNFGSLLKLILAPLTNKYFWRWNMLDINFFFFFTLYYFLIENEKLIKKTR